MGRHGGDNPQVRIQELKALIRDFITTHRAALSFIAVLFGLIAGVLSYPLIHKSFAAIRPVLLSRALQGYFSSYDFQSALRASGLHKEDIIFELKSDDFYNKLKKIKGSRRPYLRFCRYLKNSRSWERLAISYREVLLS